MSKEFFQGISGAIESIFSSPVKAASLPSSTSEGSGSSSTASSDPVVKDDPVKSAERAAEQQGSSEDPGCLSGKCCQLVTEAMIRAVWPHGNAKRISIVAEGLNININDGKIDNELRLTHFIAQAKHETGPSLAFAENLNYDEEGLFTSRYSYYNGHRDRCKRDARNVEAIANNAMADENRKPGFELGNTQPGDGWRYRGRGLHQLTGRDNYRNFTRDHEKIWGEKIDFEANPELVDQPIYAVRSALAFWVRKKLYDIADRGASDDVTDDITRVINSGLFDKKEGIKNHVIPRRQNVNKIYSRRVFKDVCFNTSKLLSNAKAREPR
ncbi:hypothetical protein [Thioclava sp. GXIMD4216]|uniref:glycoside hydrolase family 19 protein n=1 Tax=Thioclava sp. GXIMD4216 TaxID=3131929 RepID=UPI0030CA6F87